MQPKRRQQSQPSLSKKESSYKSNSSTKEKKPILKNGKNYAFLQQKLELHGKLYQLNFSEFLNFKMVHRDSFKLDNNLSKQIIEEVQKEFQSKVMQFQDRSSFIQSSNVVNQMITKVEQDLVGDYDLRVTETMPYHQKHHEIISNMKQLLTSNQLWVESDILNIKPQAHASANFFFQIKRNFDPSPLEAHNQTQENKRRKKYIKQILKLALAARVSSFQQLQSQERVNQFKNFLNKKPYLIESSNYPVSSIYYVINNDMTFERFKNQIKGMQPLMKFWFQYFNATLHVIGFNPLGNSERKKLQKFHLEGQGLRKDLSKTQERLTETTTKLSKTQERLTETTTKLSKTQERLTETTTKLSKTQEQLSETTTKLSKTQEQLSILTKKMSAMQAMIEQMKNYHQLNEPK